MIVYTTQNKAFKFAFTRACYWRIKYDETYRDIKASFGPLLSVKGEAAYWNVELIDPETELILKAVKEMDE